MMRHPSRRDERAIHWLETAHRAVQRTVPQTGGPCFHVVERLSALFLQRLTPDLGSELVALLPEELHLEFRALRGSARIEADRSIGYAALVEAAQLGLGGSLDCDEELGRRVADAFLWAVAADLPADLKARLVPELPLELRSRMNLYSAFSEAEKVA